MRTLLTFLLAIAFSSGCAASRSFAPLEQGQVAVTSTMGGPIVNYFGGHKPLPQSDIGIAYGLNGKTTVHTALHPTQLALFGLFGMDIGINTELVEPDGARPRVMVDGTLYFFAGNNAEGLPKGGARLFPDIQVVAAWPVGNHHFYTGLDNFIQPFPVLRWFPSPMLGTELRAGPVGFQFETKWLGWFSDTDNLTPSWAAPGKQGAISTQMGINLYFGGAQ